jgi:hypothetical protein
MTNNPRKRLFPLNPDSDHLGKEAKAQLTVMKARVPGARLSDIQFMLARKYGFASWRALQAEVLRRAAARKVRQFRRVWRLAIAPKSLMDEDFGEAHLSFFGTGVATLIGVFFVAIVGVGMVCLTEEQMRTLHAVFSHLALLAHKWAGRA